MNENEEKGSATDNKIVLVKENDTKGKKLNFVLVFKNFKILSFLFLVTSSFYNLYLSLSLSLSLSLPLSLSLSISLFLSLIVSVSPSI